MKNILNTFVFFLILAFPANAGNLSLIGLDDPEVIAPAAPAWSGAYAGVSFGRTTGNYTETVTDYDQIVCDDENADWTGGCDPEVPEEFIGNADINALPDYDYPEWNCEGPDGPYTVVCVIDRDGDGNALVLWMPRMVLEFATGQHTEVNDFSDEGAGAFAGYRHQFDNNFVVGTELGFADYSGQYGYIELQTGMALGRVLPYASYGVGQYAGFTGDVMGVGADIMLGDRWLVGIKNQSGTFGNVDMNVTSVRIGIRF